MGACAEGALVEGCRLCLLQGEAVQLCPPVSTAQNCFPSDPVRSPLTSFLASFLTSFLPWLPAPTSPFSEGQSLHVMGTRLPLQNAGAQAPSRREPA